jgi:hypothetical protein
MTRVPPPRAQARPPHARLPGFISDKEVGLGDAVAHVAQRLGIRACGGCARRAAALNRLIVFTRRQK